MENNLISLPSFINFFIQNGQYRNYLELGVMDGATFRAVECDKKTSVDNMASRGGWSPDYIMDTDSFFRNVAPTLPEKFDIIFIDAFHEAEQTYRDIVSSLLYLKEGGADHYTRYTSSCEEGNIVDWSRHFL
jgi:hypothetical protein